MTVTRSLTLLLVLLAVCHLANCFLFTLVHVYCRSSRDCDHGECYTDYKCHCDRGWTGTHCNISTDYGSFGQSTGHHTSRVPCYNHYCYHGYCSRAEDCVCDEGWSDYQCNTDETVCNQNNCFHGDCLDSRCKCHSGWNGTTCENPLHTYKCDGQPCIHGNCRNLYGSQECHCLSGWTGRDCSQKLRVSREHCSQSVYCDHGRCHYPRGSTDLLKCNCFTGWTGPSCSDIDNSCGNTTCHNGLCHTDVGRSEKYCVCDEGWSGAGCDLNEQQGITTEHTTTTVKTPPTRSTTSSTPPTTTKTSVPTSTSTSKTTSNNPLLHMGSCSKMSTITAVGNIQISSNNNANACPSGSKTSPEAFILNHCNMTSSNTWRSGINVLSNCHSIRPYTPIATFVHGRYSSSGSLSGVFVSCLSNGFVMGVQHCDRTPMFEDITLGGVFTMDPTTYFTIMH